MLDPNENADKNTQPDVYEDAEPLEIDPDAFEVQIGKYQQMLTTARDEKPHDEAANNENEPDVGA